MMCRHDPTCSNYMMEAITVHGWKRGLVLGMKRLKSCRPKGSFGYDPVPKKEEIL